MILETLKDDARVRSIRSTDCSSTTFGAGVQGSSSAAYEPWPTSSTSSSSPI